MVQVYFFPSGASSLSDHPWWFALLAVAGLVTSFTSTLMFTALGSFYTRISDPDMGGSYLTLLNTIANMGEQQQHPDYMLIACPGKGRATSKRLNHALLCVLPAMQ